MLDKNRLARTVKEKEAYLIALEELDRTGKLRKVHYKEKATFTIDEGLMGEFRRYCLEHGLKMSTVLEKQIEGLLRK